VDQLGEIPIEREDGTMRIMVCQMGGCAGKEVREIGMSTTEKRIQKYDVNLVSELISQLSIMAPPGRKGDKIHNSTQHTGTGCNLFKTPTKRYGHDMLKRIYPIPMQGISRSKRTWPLVFMAILL